MLYTEGAVIMGLLHFLLPYMILNVYVSLESIDRTLISAARSMGCTSAQAFREVTLPLSLPGLAAGLLLCFVLAAGSYVTPQLLGGSRDALFGNLIYDTIMSQLNWPMGATLSIVLFVLLGCFAADLHPLHGHVADHQGARRMTARRGDQDGKWAWRLTGVSHALRLHLPVRADHRHRRPVVQRLDVRRLPDDRLQPAMVRQAARQRAGADARSRPRCGSRSSPPR